MDYCEWAHAMSDLLSRLSQQEGLGAAERPEEHQDAGVQTTAAAALALGVLAFAVASARHYARRMRRGADDGCADAKK